MSFRVFLCEKKFRFITPISNPMKSILLSLLVLFSLSGISQTTVFNEGWDTQPKKIISATANTAIVFETNTMGLGRYGKLLKYKVVGDEYVKVGEIWAPEILVDFRFDVNNKLHTIGLQKNHCDYTDSTDFWIHTIDTAFFTLDTTRQMIQTGSFHRITFLSDNELVAIDYNDTKLYSLQTEQFTTAGLSTWGGSTDLVKGLFGGQFILSHSNWKGLFIENTNQHFAGTHIGHLTQKPTEAYSFGTDSILIVTDSAIYKTDTNLYPTKSVSIPYHKCNKIVGNRLYLINGNTIQTWSLPGVTLVSSDTLAGLPTKFKLVDVFPNNQKMAALALAQNSSALNEMVVKADIYSSNETERSEIRVDSIWPVDTIAIATSGGWFQYEVLFRVYCYNDGIDTINSFQCLYSDYPHGTICGPLLNSFKQITIAPGSTGSFDQKVKIDGGKNNICFYVSAPNSNLEDNLNDNRSCMSFTISLDELSEKPLINIYPNPTSGLLYIEGDLRKKAEVNLFGMDGREYKVVVNITSDEKLTVDLSHIASGVYFLKIQSGDQTLIKKVIKN